MKLQEAQEVKKTLDLASEQYTDATKYFIGNFRIKETTTKKLGIFNSKNYTVILDVNDNGKKLELPLEIFDSSGVQRVVDIFNQSIVSNALSDPRRIASLTGNKFDPEKIREEYEQLNNSAMGDKTALDSQSAGSKYFSGLYSSIINEYMQNYMGTQFDSNSDIKFSKIIQDEASKLFDFKFDLGQLDGVKNCLVDAEKMAIASCAENQGVNELIYRYLSTRENLPIPEQQVFYEIN